ncbi:amino acid permease [Phenylobacterium immobile]|uniref:amino acid permease n=1 Tax=Phenylobacterium immobile TaxID=21 RepID=UPI000A894652|nr:amino acid permease [Phenylobacterium immobile]
MKIPALEPEEAVDSPLGRTLLSRHVAMISIGGIIGAGLFVGSSASIHAVGPAILVSYALAGLIVLMVMRMLGEMALALPGITAFTEFARVGLGNWAGFTSGWLYWYFWVVVVAIEAIAGATLIQHWIDLPLWLVGWALLAVLTGSNLTSTRTYGETEFWFASLKVGAIVAFIVVAGAYVLGLTSGRGPDISNLVAHGGFAPMGPASVLAGVTTVIFSLCGAEISTIAAAESPEPAQTIAKLTSSVILRIILFYVGALFLILAIVPWNEITPGQSPFVLAMERINVPAAGAITNVIVLTAVLSCLNSGLYVASRILFTLASRGDAPQWAVAVNRRKVPARSILIASSFGWLAILAAVISPDGVFAFLVNASGATMLVIYLLSALAQIRLRREFERTDPGRLQFKVWLFPWLSYVTVAAIVGVLAAMTLTPSLASQFWVSGLLAALVAGCFFVFRKGKKGAAA